MWTLYKEVQSFYDGGMEVPDDVTLMFADDNWGNIRRLPPAGGARAVVATASTTTTTTWAGRAATGG